jgi:hypothetical protein
MRHLFADPALVWMVLLAALTTWLASPNTWRTWTIVVCWAIALCMVVLRFGILR